VALKRPQPLSRAPTGQLLNGGKRSFYV